MMPRDTPASVREAIIRAFEENQDFMKVAEILGVKRSTAYKIVAKFKASGQREALLRGGCRPHVITDDMRAALVTFVEEKPTVTLGELRAKLGERFPDHNPSSIMTISRALDGELLTLKLLRSIPTQWNSEEVKLERKAHVEWLLSNAPRKTFIFMDECGFNIWTACTHGRSFRGQRAVRIVCGQPGQNLTLLMAVSHLLGLVHYTMLEGGMTKEKFQEFVIEVSALVEDREHVTI